MSPSVEGLCCERAPRPRAIPIGRQSSDVSYAVREIFYTLQGEGRQTGRPAVFCRFAGCNLWSGLERDRETAMCRFCDTDFVGVDGPGGGRFGSSQELGAAIARTWPQGWSARVRPFVVCT